MYSVFRILPYINKKTNRQHCFVDMQPPPKIRMGSVFSGAVFENIKFSITKNRAKVKRAEYHV